MVPLKQRAMDALEGAKIGFAAHGTDRIGSEPLPLPVRASCAFHGVVRHNAL
jgi:hypothetical protein